MHLIKSKVLIYSSLARNKTRLFCEQEKKLINIKKIFLLVQKRIYFPLTFDSGSVMIKWLRLELAFHLTAYFCKYPNIPILTWTGLEPAKLYEDANNLAVQGKYATISLVFMQFKGHVYHKRSGSTHFTVSTWKFLVCGVVKWRHPFIKRNPNIERVKRVVYYSRVEWWMGLLCK